MGNRISRKNGPNSPDRGSATARPVGDLEGLQENGRQFLDSLNLKLSKTETDKEALEQELNNVRGWLDRVDAANAELLDALKEAKGKTSSISDELESKKQRIRTLEAQSESDQDRIAHLESNIKDLPSNVGRSRSMESEALKKDLKRITEERDRFVADLERGVRGTTDDPETDSGQHKSDSETGKSATEYQEEITQLKMELRKKDRVFRRQIRSHSRQLRDVSEAEIARDWRSEQELLSPSSSAHADADKSMEPLLKTHASALMWAQTFLEGIVSLTESESKELDKLEKQWGKEADERRQQMQNLNIYPGDPIANNPNTLPEKQTSKMTLSDKKTALQKKPSHVLKVK